MSAGSDAHLSYLVHWAFLMVARIVLVMGVAGALLALLVGVAGGSTGTAIAAAAVSQPIALVLTIYLSPGPKYVNQYDV
jgi:hypothetical protein